MMAGIVLAYQSEHAGKSNTELRHHHHMQSACCSELSRLICCRMEGSQNAAGLQQ